jgi:hypothetical protein
MTCAGVMSCPSRFNIDPRIRSIIHNVGLFNEVKHLQLQLQPVSNGLDRLQSDSSTLADACETWIDLLQNSDLQTYKDKVHHRFQKAMTPTHYLANILHSKNESGISDNRALVYDGF